MVRGIFGIVEYVRSFYLHNFEKQTFISFTKAFYKA